MSVTIDRESMISELTSQSERIREELIELERQFNVKKEQFLKIQGALEALSILGNSPEEVSEES